MTTRNARLDPVTVGSIVIRCHEFERMAAFWREVLRYAVVHADPNGHARL